MRAFLALWPPPSLLPGLIAWQERFRVSLPGAQVRWTAPGQMHLTLRFFGDLKEDALLPLCRAVETAVQGLGPLPLRLGPAGCFPSARRPRILWIAVMDETETLAALFARLASEAAGIGGAVDPPAFRPHITIGRVARLARRPQIPLEKTLNPAVHEADCQGIVDCLHLMRSTPCPGGVQHDPLARFALAPSC